MSYDIWASLVPQSIKNPSAMQKTWIRSLCWEDPLEKGMAIHSSVLAWRISMDRGAWLATVCGVAKSWTRLSNWAPHIWYFSFSVWLTSFSMTLSRSIHVAANGITSFFLMGFHCIYVPHLYLFLCQWYLGCFPVLAIVNSAAMNSGVHDDDSPQIYVQEWDCRVIW